MSSDSTPNDFSLETSTTAEVRVTTTSWEQVQEVCGVFSADREAGKPAVFSEYLDGFDNYGRETVLRNLLYLELQSRLRSRKPLETRGRYQRTPTATNR